MDTEATPAGRARAAWIWCVPAALLAGALAVRLPGLFTDLWMDEIWSLNLSRSVASPWEILTRQQWGNNHPLNTLLLWATPDGAPEWVLRLPSLLFGMATVAAAGVWVRAAGGTSGAALCAAWAVAFSLPAIVLSSEARGYAGGMACALGAAICLVRGQSSRRGRGWAWTGWNLLAILALLFHPGTHSTLLAALLGDAIGAGIGWRTRLAWRQPIGLAIRHLPWLTGALAYHLLFLRHLKFGAAGYQSALHAWALAARDLLNAVWTPEPTAGLAALAVLAIAAPALWAVARGAGWPPALLLLLAGALLPLVAPLAHPPRVTGQESLLAIFPRHYLFGSIWTLIAIGWGTALWWRRGGRARWIALALASVQLSGAGVGLGRFYRDGRGHYRDVVRFILSEEPGAGNIQLGSNEQTRAATQLGHYVNLLPPEAARRFQFPHPSRWQTQPPGWMIVFARGRLPARIEPVTLRGAAGDIVARYDLKRIYRYGGFSGWHCLVSRRAARAGG